MQIDARLHWVFIVVVTTRPGNPRSKLYSDLQVPAYVAPQGKAAACLNSTPEACLNSLASLWQKLLSDPRVSQETSLKSSSESRFLQKKLKQLRRTKSEDTAGLCCVLNLSSYAETSGIKQLATTSQLKQKYLPCRCSDKNTLPSPVQQTGKPVTGF